MSTGIHEHAYFSIKNKELTFAIGSGIFWLTGLIFSFLQSADLPFTIWADIIPLLRPEKIY